MKRIEHIGVAVESGQEASATFARLLGGLPYKSEVVEREGIETLFIDAGGPKLELLNSISPDSAVARFLAKRGEGLHHLAFEVADITSELERVREEGFTVLSDQPLEGADGKLIFFVHPKDCHGILVEFCQQVRANWETVDIRFGDDVARASRAGSRSSPTVLFLQGASSSAMDELSSLLPSLERRVQLIGLHAPSPAGRGEPAGSDALPEASARIALAALDAFRVERPVLAVGIGLGAEAALELISMQPDRVGALLVVDPMRSHSRRFENAWQKEPLMVCSRHPESLGVAIDIADRVPGAKLSVIPELDSGQSHFAELIAACAEWI